MACFLSPMFSPCTGTEQQTLLVATAKQQVRFTLLYVYSPSKEASEVNCQWDSLP